MRCPVKEFSSLDLSNRFGAPVAQIASEELEEDYEEGIFQSQIKSFSLSIPIKLESSLNTFLYAIFMAFVCMMDLRSCLWLDSRHLFFLNNKHSNRVLICCSIGRHLSRSGMGLLWTPQ